MQGFNYICKSILTVVCLMMAYFKPIQGAINIFLAFFIADFITGVLASFKKGERFKSSKARWSFAKLVCYTGAFMFEIFIAKQIQQINVGDDYSTWLWIIKITVYAGVWFEAKSVIENLLILYPNNRFLRFMDFILGVEFIKRIPGLADFLKEEKDKQIKR